MRPRSCKEKGKRKKAQVGSIPRTFAFFVFTSYFFAGSPTFFKEILHALHILRSHHRTDPGSAGRGRGGRPGGLLEIQFLRTGPTGPFLAGASRKGQGQ